MRVEVIAPRAAMLIESMRDIGYSLETALSDIIDNSIAAGADKIEILIDPSAASPRIAIFDNGRGMGEPELLDAMRAGSRNPLHERSGPDLGRFGLGLKTASFSQCRRMTVVSKKDGLISFATWDLDHVATTDRWEVMIPASIDAVPDAENLAAEGTLVLWENLDRVLGDIPPEEAMQVLSRRIDEARTHIELVFHRFLAAEPGHPKIAILLNKSPLHPHDPFASKHPAAQRDPEEIRFVKGHKVTLQSCTLPHHTKLTAKEHEALGGTAGYLKNQGFYLYRERRLIIWGTWFNMVRARPITQLTRVRIDMPRELDAEWKIDVKKASAQPPLALREYMRGLVERICFGSKRVYTHKGQRLNPDDRLEVWSRVQDKGEIRYRVNSDHPIVASLNAELSTEGQHRLKALLRIMENDLPIDSIFADKGGDPKSIVTGSISEADLKVLAIDTYKYLNNGTTERSERALDMLQTVSQLEGSWPQILQMLATEFSWS
jgi:hypothetical protein